jgi:hypothetical protein
MAKIGRRPLLLWGALGMVICQFLVAISGVVAGDKPSVVSAQISFICIYIGMYFHSNFRYSTDFVSLLCIHLGSRRRIRSGGELCASLTILGGLEALNTSGFLLKIIVF